MTKRKPLQIGERIFQVIVRPRGKPSFLYICHPLPIGFKCGHCLRGNLGPLPKRRQKCRVCHSTVHEVRAILGHGEAAKIRQL